MVKNLTTMTTGATSATGSPGLTGTYLLRGSSGNTYDGTDPTSGLVTRIRKEQGIIVGNIRCDNSGENKKLK
jgi:hypothetical protein